MVLYAKEGVLIMHQLGDVLSKLVSRTQSKKKKKKKSVLNLDDIYFCKNDVKELDVLNRK